VLYGCFENAESGIQSCPAVLVVLARWGKIMKIDIDDLTEKELIELNHRVVERLKFLEAMRSHVEMMEFGIGEKVSFRPAGRGRLVGVLVKYNKKTVTVLTEDGEKWNVSPHLLESVKGNEGANKKSGNVIEIKPK
jgi:hypothetical protein